MRQTLALTEAPCTPLRESPIELQLALLACHWMRDAALSGD